MFVSSSPAMAAAAAAVVVKAEATKKYFPVT